jgi:hypothetical protein
MAEGTRNIVIPPDSTLREPDYRRFLHEAYALLARQEQYLAPGEGIDALELAHLLPTTPETVIAIYVGINDAVCNKGLVSPFLLRHAHNNVFVFDPEVYPGGGDVPAGTIDARTILTGFEPPNDSWPTPWTYVMIREAGRSVASLWREKGYIDLIPAKFEDFTMLSDPAQSRVCTFIDPKAFDHPVNAARDYLQAARQRGEKMAHEFDIPEALAEEVDGLAPVVLYRGEKLYVATTDFSPCAHAWSNLHPDNQEYAVINENSAVPLDLVIAKPPVNPRYARGLIAPRGSADLTTDWFYRGLQVVRTPILTGLTKG